MRGKITGQFIKECKLVILPFPIEFHYIVDLLILI